MASKYFLISVLLLLITFAADAQDKYFIKTLGTPKKDMGLHIDRSDDGGFFLTGVTFNYDSSGDAIFYKTDSLGAIKWGLNIGVNSVYDYAVFSLEKPNGDFLLGIGSDASNLKFRLVSTDSGGNVLSDSSYYVSNGFPDIVVDAGYMLNDTSFISIDIVRDSLLYVRKWNTDGTLHDSLKLLSSMDFGENKVYIRNTYEYNGLFYINSFIETSVTTNVIFVLNNNLSIYDSSKFSNSSVFGFKAISIDLNNQFLTTSGFAATWPYLYFGRYSIAQDSLLWTDNYEFSDHYISSLDQVSDGTNIYICGQSQGITEDTTKAAMFKFDTIGALQWHKQYTIDGYKKAVLISTKYYSDCIASVGYAYDPNDQNSYEIVFVKSDLNGNVGIDDYSDKIHYVAVYPNPVNDYFSFNLQLHDKAEYEITDMLGKVVKTGDLDCNLVGISNLVSGIYLLNINDGEIHYRGIFIKE